MRSIDTESNSQAEWQSQSSALLALIHWIPLHRVCGHGVISVFYQLLGLLPPTAYWLFKRLRESNPWAAWASGSKRNPPFSPSHSKLPTAGMASTSGSCASGHNGHDSPYLSEHPLPSAVSEKSPLENRSKVEHFSLEGVILNSQAKGSHWNRSVIYRLCDLGPVHLFKLSFPHV